MRRIICYVSLLAVSILVAGTSFPAKAQESFRLAPAVAVEAEDFTVEKGWRPIRLGEGNYAVDIIGFSHTSGERFLHADAATASAFLDINVPAHQGANTPRSPAPYRLWVRYEYMPFTESRFKVVVEQSGKVLAEKVMGGKENPRISPWSEGLKLEPQYDAPWGNKGITEEPLDVPALAAGKARLRLVAVVQPRIAGVTADRNIDCLYLTSDTKDAWRQQPRYKVWYGILNAIRDTRGARYEVQSTNHGPKAMGLATSHYYNRGPIWYDNADPDATLKTLQPGRLPRGCP